MLGSGKAIQATDSSSRTHFPLSHLDCPMSLAAFTQRAGGTVRQWSRLQNWKSNQLATYCSGPSAQCQVCCKALPDLDTLNPVTTTKEWMVEKIRMVLRCKLSEVIEKADTSLGQKPWKIRRHADLFFRCVSGSGIIA